MTNETETPKRLPFWIEVVLLLPTTALVYWLLQRTNLTYIVGGVYPESTLTRGLVSVIEFAGVNVLTLLVFVIGLVEIGRKRLQK